MTHTDQMRFRRSIGFRGIVSPLSKHPTLYRSFIQPVWREVRGSGQTTASSYAQLKHETDVVVEYAKICCSFWHFFTKGESNYDHRN